MCGGDVETLKVLYAGSGWRERFYDVEHAEGSFVSVTQLALPPKSTKITHLTLQGCTFSKNEMQTILYVYVTLRMASAS
jgi:hypothetical protein